MHCKPISVNTKCQSHFKKKCMYVMHTHTHTGIQKEFSFVKNCRENFLIIIVCLVSSLHCSIPNQNIAMHNII